MSLNNFDERQLVARWHSAQICFWVLIAFVAINAILVDANGMWGSGEQQMIAVVIPALTLYTVMLIWQHAYNESTSGRVWLPILIALACTIFVWARNPIVWQSGRAQAGFEAACMTVMFLIVAAVLALRQLKDQRDGAQDAD